MATYLSSEIQILSKVSHPNIIKVNSIVETDRHCFFSLELAENGSLLDYINQRPAIPEQEARFLFNQMCNAVQYCHSQDIAHRDIKCDNMLLDRFMNIKLGGMLYTLLLIKYIQYLFVYYRFRICGRLEDSIFC